MLGDMKISYPGRASEEEMFTVKTHIIVLRFQDQKQERCRKSFPDPRNGYSMPTRYWPQDVCKRSHKVDAQPQFRFPLVNLTFCFIERTLPSSSGGIKCWDTARLVGLRLLMVGWEPSI